MKARILIAQIIVLILFSFLLVSCAGDDNDDDDDASTDDDDNDDDDDTTPDDDDDDDTTPCDGCFIDEICYPNGEMNPDNVCEICDVSASIDSWTDNDGVTCDDGVFCNGEDTCDAGSCSVHVGDPCTGGDVCNNTCNEGTDDCFSPDTTSCDDGVFCNGEDMCDGAGTCDHPGDPCEAYENCNETFAECYDPEIETFIPAGSFWMGCEPNDTECNTNESPRHQVTLSPYYIDTYEVTNEEYAAFLTAYGNVCDGNECADADDVDIRVHESGGVWTSESRFEDHPMMEVSWYGAKVFCEYYGSRLPTEAEWEKAAKGAAQHYIYPWGETWIANAANWYDNNDPWETGEYPWTNPVGYYDGSNHGGAYQTSDGRSPYGVHDMAGNVWEWVNDWYLETYYSTSPSTDPPGPTTGEYRVLRGGSWLDDPRGVRASRRFRARPTVTNDDGGFRCVGTEN